MRQFKIIDTSPDKKTGLITTNFALPIKMSVGSQIALDKFQCVLDDATGNFSLPNQTLIIDVGNGVPSFDVFLPANTYGTITDLLIYLNKVTNDAWSAYTAVTTYGLKFAFTETANVVSMGFVSVTFTELSTSLIPVNCSPDNTGIFVINDDASPPAEFEGSDIKLQLAGGGMALEFEMRPDIEGGISSIECGLTDGTYTVYIQQGEAAGAGEVGVVSFISEFPGGTTQIIDSALFYPGGVPTKRFVSIYQINGIFQCRIAVSSSLDAEVLYESNPTLGGGWDLSLPLTMVFNGTCNGAKYAEAGGVGNIIQTVDEPVGIDPFQTGFSHTVTVNFQGSGGTNADIIRRALGFTNFVTLMPEASPYGSAVGNTINFSPIQGALDIAIELMDMPLETYEVGASQYPFPRTGTAIAGVRQPGARKNVIGYFLPLPIGTAIDGVFSYAQSQYQWLDLANKQPLEFTSLSFRVYIATTGVPLKCNSLSFNFLTREDYEAGKK